MYNLYAQIRNNQEETNSNNFINLLKAAEKDAFGIGGIT
jgi:hypothetical protein